MRDPTREELTNAILFDFPYVNETDEMDREQAIYWIATHYHSGQSSNLYSVLSTSEYRPGTLERGCDVHSTAGDLYCRLRDAFFPESTDEDSQS